MVNTDILGGSFYRPAIALNDSGSFVICWHDERNSYQCDIYARRYDTGGNPIGGDFMVNNDIGDYGQFNPDMAINNNGRCVITWEDGRAGPGDIYAQIYDASGNPTGGNFKVNDDEGSFKHSQPAIAMDNCGQFVIAWIDYRADSLNIYAQAYDSAGNTLGGNFRVNDDSSAVDQLWPDIALNDSGRLVIVWTDYRDYEEDIFAQIYAFPSDTVGTNFKINDDAASARQLNPSISLNNAGQFAITWTDYRDGNLNIFAQNFDADGNTTGANYTVNDDLSPCKHTLPAITMDSLGGIAICWEDERYNNPDIYAQRYAPSGDGLDSNFKVHVHGDANQSEPKIAVNESGDFAIAWIDYRSGGWDRYLQKYDSDCIAIAANQKINDADHYPYESYLAIAMDNLSRCVTVWCDTTGAEADIYAQRYDVDGLPAGPNFRINDDGGGISQDQAAAAMDASGNFLIAWYDYRDGLQGDIYAQRYDCDGNPIGENINLSNNAANSWQEEFALAMNDSGFFALVWKDNLDDYNGDIFARRYDPVGTPLGSAFKINDDIGYTIQKHPSIGMDGAGNFIVAWEDNRDGHDIFAQRYDTSGLAIDTNFKVSSNTNSGYNPAAAMDQNGRQIIVWDNYAQGQGDIYIQKYDSEGLPINSNLLVNDGESVCYHQSYPSAATNTSGIYIVWQDSRRDKGWDIYAKVIDWGIEEFTCGDANADGGVNVSDVVWILNYIFVPGSPPPDPMESGEVNCDGSVNVSDAVWLLNYIFSPGSPAPCECK